MEAVAAAAVAAAVAVHVRKRRMSVTDGDGEADQDDGNERQMHFRPLHVTSEIDGNVTIRLEMFAVGDAPVIAVASAAVLAVGNDAPVGDAPTRAESGGRCYR